MLQTGVVWQIREKLREGNGFRKIARALGVNHHTVAAVAARLAATDAEAEVDEDLRPFVRCPECGMKVQMPCVICETRAERAAARLVAMSRSKANGAPRATHSRALEPLAEDDLDLKLDGHYRQRYEEVRDLRLLEEAEDVPVEVPEPALPWLVDEEDYDEF